MPTGIEISHWIPCLFSRILILLLVVILHWFPKIKEKSQKEQ